MRIGSMIVRRYKALGKFEEEVSLTTREQGINSKTRHFDNLSNLVFLFLVLSISLVLHACGGGGGGGSSASTVPVANNGCDYVGYNQPLSGSLTGSDPGGRSLSYSIATNPTNGSLTLTNPTTGQFTYTPNTDARGTDSFTFRVNNGQTSSNTATYRLVYIPRIMPVGDSITEGVTLGGNPNQPDPSLRISYRKKLYELLSGAGYRIDFVGSLSNGTAAGVPDPDHEGHAGWCDDNSPPCSGSGNFNDSITSILNNIPPDMILLHIGTNQFSTDASGVNGILDKVSAWASSSHPLSVFLARIIPSVDGSLQVTTFNNNVQGIATDRPNIRIFIVDQQAELRSGGDANKADPLLMGDNLHPNQTGYDRMANRWANSLFASGMLSKCP